MPGRPWNRVRSQECQDFSAKAVAMTLTAHLALLHRQPRQESLAV
jgi:hypothetical protein